MKNLKDKLEGRRSISFKNNLKEFLKKEFMTSFKKIMFESNCMYIMFPHICYVSMFKFAKCEKNKMKTKEANKKSRQYLSL